MTKAQPVEAKAAAYHLTVQWRWGTAPKAAVTVTAVYLCDACYARLPTVLWLLQPAPHALVVRQHVRPANALERRELHCCACGAVAALPDEVAYSDALAAEAEQTLRAYRDSADEPLFDPAEVAAMEAEYWALEMGAGWSVVDVDDLRTLEAPE